MQSLTAIPLLTLLLCCAAGNASAQHLFATNDIVAFVGGADVAAAQHSGHLEAFLAIQHRGMGVRFRNFGWEGDTVFEQPRDIGFPSLLANLQKAGATVVVLQFGRAEALSGKRTVTEFREAYAKLLGEFAPKFRKLILVTPVPFENAGGLLPDLSKQNPVLAQHSAVIRELARDRRLMLIDVFDEITRHSRKRLTSDGLQLTEAGHAQIAHAVAGQASHAWRHADYERVRRAVIEKNRLWFDYSRPQNWAFLGGDRVSQPSSRDHRDPKVRWFPAEMEKFLPLIAEAEKRIEQAAAQAMTSP